MLVFLLFAVSLLALYFIIRKAVTQGILDADEARRAREREQRFEEVLRKGNVLDAPKS